MTGRNSPTRFIPRLRANQDISKTLPIPQRRSESLIKHLTERLLETMGLCAGGSSTAGCCSTLPCFFSLVFFRKRAGSCSSRQLPDFPRRASALRCALLPNLAAILQTEGSKTVVISKLPPILAVCCKVSQTDGVLKMNLQKPRRWMELFKPAC